MTFSRVIDRHLTYYSAILLTEKNLMHGRTIIFGKREDIDEATRPREQLPRPNKWASNLLHETLARQTPAYRGALLFAGNRWALVPVSSCT